ncbi:MAG: hypothetical protein K0S07_948 [Chlamydiales bacterium]|jgi:hypothetical protein|nr:hypothetical protein [Chlamydiales bacterium]
MNFQQLSSSFNRALSFTFLKKKLLLVAGLLAVCGLFSVFCRSLAIHAGPWVSLSLAFVPLFLSCGLLFSAGILLTRIYHNEVKGISFSYREVLQQSLEPVVGSAYLFIPILLLYLILWMLLGFFYFLQELPLVGPFFSTVFIIGPFLLNLGSLLLLGASFLILFFLSPLVALKAGRGAEYLSIVQRRLQMDFFSNGLLLFLALCPFLVMGGILLLAAYLTNPSGLEMSSVLHLSLERFFLMIPFALFLSPSIVFFFNFAAEAHVAYAKIGKGELT